MKKILILTAIILNLYLLSGCNGETVQVDIYTSIYPLEFIVKNIVEDDYAVRSVFPRGKDVHTYEVSPKDLMSVVKSKIIFYIGLGLEWIIEDSVDSTLADVPTVSVVKNLTLIEVNSDHVHHDEDHHDHTGVFFDAHVWLDPTRMITITDNILEALFEHLTPTKTQKEKYEQNAEELKGKFLKLDEEFKKLVSAEDIDNKTILVDHDAYAYWNDTYGIERIRLRTDNESNDVAPAVMQKKISQAKELRIRYICVTKNELESSIINQYMNALEIPQENKLSLHTLATITSEEEKAGLDYFSIMEHNLEVLRRVFPKK
ncbi:MAG TPA: zinc ABC transporter substrate-binding protein [Acholeplasmataceae bacterium]|jgi:zinc transport system substrate-binding protein|nr:zinc ABC transporter substrate-binding protein [Acholeplasmataceae bacterium]